MAEVTVFQPSNYQSLLQLAVALNLGLSAFPAIRDPLRKEIEHEMVRLRDYLSIFVAGEDGQPDPERQKALSFAHVLIEHVKERLDREERYRVSCENFDVAPAILCALISFAGLVATSVLAPVAPIVPPDKIGVMNALGGVITFLATFLIVSFLYRPVGVAIIRSLRALWDFRKARKELEKISEQFFIALPRKDDDENK